MVACATCGPQVYYEDNDVWAELSGLRDVITGTYQNSATVEATLIDTVTDTPVVGQSWPLTLDYVASSDGVYRGILQDTLAVAPGDRLSMHVSIVSGTYQSFWDIPVIVQKRRA